MKIIEEAVEKMKNNNTLLALVLLLISWTISEKYLQYSFVNPNIFSSLIGMFIMFGIVGLTLILIFSFIIMIEKAIKLKEKK